MKKLFIPCFLLVAATFAAIAEDKAEGLKPGRFVLISEGESARAPMIVDVSKSESGGLKATLEDRPEISAEIKRSENAYVFSLIIPADRAAPPEGQDWPMRYYLTYAGEPSKGGREALRGVCTEIFTYNNPGNAPVAKTASFVLFSIDKVEKPEPANP